MVPLVVVADCYGSLLFGFSLMEVKFAGALIQNPVHKMPCTFIHFLLIMAGWIDLYSMVLIFPLDRC